ncbi:MAG: 4-hydroxyproline epimerase [Pseudomonadota bacterium]
MSGATFFCIDGHTCGNPVRLVTGGAIPRLDGDTMFARRQHFLAQYDWIRTALMFEPRGHDMMSGALLYPPTRDDCDIGVLYIETSGCLPMCGHGTIGVVTFAIEHGLVEPKRQGQLRLDTPAGLVIADYVQDGDDVTSVRLTNVPAFLFATGLEADVPGLGPVTCDVAYGGNFYAIVEAQENFQDLAHVAPDDLIRWAGPLRENLNARYTFAHPENPDINHVSHVLWTGAPTKPNSTARNAVIYGRRAIDRSPCGTGTSARIAQWVAQGRLKIGDDFIHESIIGSQFSGRAERATKVGNIDAIIPSIEGWARMTGHNTITVDRRDPYWSGFQVG